jgi:hypothetical protein
MAIPSRIMAAGTPALAAQQIAGNGAVGIVALGSTQAGATQLTDVFNTITTSSASTGLLLPACEKGALIFIYNLSGQTQQIYTQEATGVTINAAIAGATGVALGNTKTAICFAPSRNTWVVAAALSST